MENKNLNISNIETYLHSIIDNKVSNNTFVGTLPDTINQKWNDMCLIDCSSTIKDYDAFGYGVVLIWLYARPLSNGTKNVFVMAELENRLNEIINNSKSKEYVLNRRNTYTDYDSIRKWHCNIVEINLRIY